MKIIIENIFEDESSFGGDPEMTEMIVDGIVKLRGDWYHDKLEAMIDGWLKCLDDQGIQYTKIFRDVADSDRCW